jgi:hypothetical protein
MELYFADLCALCVIEQNLIVDIASSLIYASS